MRTWKGNEIGKEVILYCARIAEETHVDSLITFSLISKSKTEY